MTTALTRTTASEAVQDIGWRYLLGAFLTYVPVPSQTIGLDAAQLAVIACGADADDHLAVDLRTDRVQLTLMDRTIAHVTARDAELARDVTAALRDRGFDTMALPDGREHGVQQLEIAVDAIDIAAVRPFWKAVFGYVDEPGRDGPEDALIDPQRIGPAVWFQQMDAPRPQRNRIHFDITVPHDEAEARVRAALDAGGVLINDTEARSFWVLADAEGNEVCVCTWQDRE